ncbi:acylphosphatase [Glaciibacter flavus]|uniref:acylphosphatase n=1 Tax=Orlajensenia flava TaxID=2565934 RepID=UPI003AFF7783
MTIRRKVVVEGTVQGVGFRYWARSEAQRLGVSGWVRNRPDDTVEAEVEGGDDAVASMVEWLRHGPRGASVTGVTVDDVATQGYGSFEING